ncbi:Tn3 family transposase [Streptomyces chrestomyceticus]|uniref:Tn3 family transposase n=1 Tax=Streptomyces chrestomyceticus TaxID=68185 RepID=UPI0019D27B23|nr:Tn3 family transposase [Streptomyces chrestomyceticus]
MRRRSVRGPRPPQEILRRFARNASPSRLCGHAGGRPRAEDHLIFVARYLWLRDLQREVEEGGLNVMELSSGANVMNAYGKGGEIASNRRDEQETFALCLRILQPPGCT